jgi:radical SAM protein (TIGR04043 family)
MSTRHADAERGTSDEEKWRHGSTRHADAERGTSDEEKWRHGSVVSLTSGPSLRIRADLAVHGARMTAPVTRRSGAGPSDDGHVSIAGTGASIPLNPLSDFVIDGERVLLDGVDTGIDVHPVARPKFYDLSTADGVSYEKIARLHGTDVLATTVIQKCIRYSRSQRCRFCTIEESLAAGDTIAVKSPGQIAEVATAAVALDGVRQLVMTTGTTNGPDRGAGHLANCVRAVIKAVPQLPIQVQIEPPADLGVIAELKAAGATAIGIHVESMNDDVRRAWMPGKSTVSLDEYRRAWTEAVRVFGANRVSSYLLIGLGDTADQIVSAAAELITLGVYPFVVPFRPLAESLAARDGAGPPSAAMVAEVTDKVAELLREAAMSGADQQAGCAACGACSLLPAAGG